MELPSPPPPTAEELTERLHQRLRAAAPRRERERGEAIGWGDEVECQLVGVVNGRILPECTRPAALLEMRPRPYLPGLIEGIVGMETFSAQTLELTLPADYPVPELASLRAQIYVEASRAQAVEMPPLDDPAALQAAGLGDSLEAALETVARELDAEQGEELLIQATDAVLGALADRLEADIPSALVDEELRRHWEGGSAALLRRFPEAFQQDARREFLATPALRADAYRRIKIGLALGALVKKEGLKPAPEDVNELLGAAAERLGLSLEAAKRAVAAEPAEARQVFDTALHLAAVQFVMARARVSFSPAAAAPAAP